MTYCFLHFPWKINESNFQGAKRTPYGVDYLVAFKDGFPMKIFRSFEARTKFPQLVIEFLEDKISVEREFRFNEQLQYADNPIEPTTEAALVYVSLNSFFKSIS